MQASVQIGLLFWHPGASDGNYKTQASIAILQCVLGVDFLL